MQLITTIDDLRVWRAGVAGQVGLVPTMGALHEGHLTLARAARAENDAVIVSIFINPTQFAQGEDFDRYPRDLDGDLALLASVGVDAVFTPTPDLMYPAGFQTWVTVTDVSRGLEGAHRPDHFRGVATVVCKLFNLTQATRAYFGQKDAQQVTVIRRMVCDLNMPIAIQVCPTLREADGLAMSSRNVYLDADQRQAATVISRALRRAGEAYAAGERDPQRLRAAIAETLAETALGVPEYISIAHPVTLQEVETATESPLLVSLTVAFGSVRLLDNCLLPLALNDQAGLTATLGYCGATP